MPIHASLSDWRGLLEDRVFSVRLLTYAGTCHSVRIMTTKAHFLRLKAVMEITGFSRTTVYRLMSKGLFPKSVKLGERAIAWRPDEIQAWVDGRERVEGGGNAGAQ